MAGQKIDGIEVSNAVKDILKSAAAWEKLEALAKFLGQFLL